MCRTKVMLHVSPSWLTSLLTTEGFKRGNSIFFTIARALFALRKILWPKDTSWPFWFATTSMFMNVFSQCEYLKAIIMYALNSHPKLEALASLASQPASLYLAARKMTPLSSYFCCCC